MSEYIDTTDKIIWICRENIGRSQVAQALWETKYPGIASLSAGILVDKPGQKVGERPEAAILHSLLLDEYGIDISQNKRRSIQEFTPEALGKAALLVVLAEDAVITDSLREQPNTHLWEVLDMKETDSYQTLDIVRTIEKGLDAVVHQLPQHLQFLTMDGPAEAR